MDRVRELLALYEILLSLRNKIFLKETTISNQVFIFNLFGRKFALHRVSDPPTGIICLKVKKYKQLTLEIDLAIKRIFILLGCYEKSSKLPNSTEVEIQYFYLLVDKTTRLCIKKTEVRDILSVASNLEKLYEAKNTV